MMDFLTFTFQSFWHFWGVMIILCLAAMLLREFGGMFRK